MITASGIRSARSRGSSIISGVGIRMGFFRESEEGRKEEEGCFIVPESRLRWFVVMRSAAIVPRHALMLAHL